MVLYVVTDVVTEVAVVLRNISLVYVQYLLSATYVLETVVGIVVGTVVISSSVVVFVAVEVAVAVDVTLTYIVVFEVHGAVMVSQVGGLGEPQSSLRFQ